MQLDKRWTVCQAMPAEAAICTADRIAKQLRSCACTLVGIPAQTCKLQLSIERAYLLQLYLSWVASFCTLLHKKKMKKNDTWQCLHIEHPQNCDKNSYNSSTTHTSRTPHDKCKYPRGQQNPQLLGLPDLLRTLECVALAEWTWTCMPFLS